MDAPNALWSADFKGQFKLGTGAYCYPLTIIDGYSRYLLACRGLEAIATGSTRSVFEAVFRTYGLPDRIRTDNGPPFATCALGRLSALSVWWIKLGITPELIQPAHPEQNGRHERMHRTLKAEATARGFQLYIPPPKRCTDNAAMIACAGHYRLVRGERADLALNATATLPL